MEQFDDFPPPQPKIRTLNFDEQRHKRKMSKLHESIFNAVEASHPSRTISQALKSRIANQMHDLFPTLHTPSHPPYALMIRMAIMELNEKWGSTEESISDFIEKRYGDLPLGHASFLSHHLKKLCGTGDIVCKNDGWYMILIDRGGGEEDCRVGSQKYEMINERNKLRGKQIVFLEHWRKVEKKAAEASEQKTERSSVSFYGEGQSNLRYKHAGVREQNNLQEFEASDNHALKYVQQNQMIVYEQNMIEEEPCMELKKNTEFQGQRMENSHPPRGLVEEEGTGQDQQQQGRLVCTEISSIVNLKVRRKLVREQEDRFTRDESQPQEPCVNGETEVLGPCREHPIQKLCFSQHASSLTTLKERQKQPLKQDYQQMRNIWEERKIVIICGLEAQRLWPNIHGYLKAPKAYPDSERQQALQDTTKSALQSSAYQQDMEPRHQLQLEGQGRGRPAKVDSKGIHTTGLNVYVRRRSSAG